MRLFGKKEKTGGFMDQIRCDEPSYLIWKWHPEGSEAGNNNRENAIRWGSSLRVKDGEIAVFVYKQQDGTIHDYIEGPYDEIIKTENFPVLASLVGLVYEGGTPFQAEVYFINLAGIIQIPFAVPFFDIFDPRFTDIGVPVAVRGAVTFSIKDYKEFIKLHRLISFDLDDFKNQVKDAVVSYVKGIVTNVPEENNIPVDISAIELDKTSDGYNRLKAVTQDINIDIIQAQTTANIKNIQDMQRINAGNIEKSLQIQRDEAQYAQHKKTQSDFISAFKVEEQAAVGKAGAEALGQMGLNGATEISVGGMSFNPAAMMTGMAMGSTMGQNVAGMMNGMLGDLNIPQTSGTTTSPIHTSGYQVIINGQAAGPFTDDELSEMYSEGRFSKDSLVWKQGLTEWVKAESEQDLLDIFANSLPPLPFHT